MVGISPLILISDKLVANPHGDNNLLSPRGDKLGDSINISKEIFRHLVSL